jgi:hypothetical protein
VSDVAFNISHDDAKIIYSFIFLKNKRIILNLFFYFAIITFFSFLFPKKHFFEFWKKKPMETIIDHASLYKHFANLFVALSNREEAVIQFMLST